MVDNPVAHVRSHGKDASDTSSLPIDDRLTGLNSYAKQCFWINNSFVKLIVSKANN